MNITAKLFIVTGLLALSHMALAQKVVVFNPQTAIFSTQAAKVLSANISQQLNPQLQRLQTLGADIETLQQRISQDQDLMSSDELQGLEDDLRAQTLEFRQLQQYINAIKEQNEQTFLQSIRPKLDAAMKQFIQANEIDLVLNANASVYAAEGVDITAQITQILDQD